MACQFLCSKHRALLSERLDATAPIWSSWMRQGEASLNAARLDDGIRYFGCAFDLALLLVERFSAHGELDGQRHMDRVLAAGTALSAALARCGHLALRREFLNRIADLHYREQLRTPLLADRLPSWEGQAMPALTSYGALSPDHEGRAGASLN